MSLFLGNLCWASRGSWSETSLGENYSGTLSMLQLPVLRQTLDHPGLPSAGTNLRAPTDPPEGRVADQWSYEPFFDDLPIPDPMLG